MLAIDSTEADKQHSFFVVVRDDQAVAELTAAECSNCGAITAMDCARPIDNRVRARCAHETAEPNDTRTEWHGTTAKSQRVRKWAKLIRRRGTPRNGDRRAETGDEYRNSNADWEREKQHAISEDDVGVGFGARGEHEGQHGQAGAEPRYEQDAVGHSSTAPTLQVTDAPRRCQPKIET